MNAMIFAAGLGTRLRPLTDNCPKALIEVGGMTMLERTVERVRDAGARCCVVNVHHLAPMVTDALAGLDPAPMQLVVSDETDCLLDTGGGLLKARPLFADPDAPTLVHNADVFTTQPLEPMVRSHRDSGADVTLLVADRPSSRKLLFGPGMVMKGWTNCTSGQTRPAALDPAGLRPFGFCGIHIVGPRALEALAEYSLRSGKTVFSITDFYIDCCDTLRIVGFEAGDGTAWFDIGRPATLEAARRFAAGAEAGRTNIGSPAFK